MKRYIKSDSSIRNKILSDDKLISSFVDYLNREKLSKETQIQSYEIDNDDVTLHIYDNDQDYYIPVLLNNFLSAVYESMSLSDAVNVMIDAIKKQVQL